MAWNTPITFVAGTPPTAAQLNAMLYDNMLETEVAKASDTSSMFGTTGLNQLTTRHIETNYGQGPGTLTNTSYSQLANMPQITMDCRSALIIWSAILYPSDGGAFTDFMAVSVDVSGATTIAATDSYSIMSHSNPTYAFISDGLMKAHYFSNLNSGVNTFKMMARTTFGTAGTYDHTILGIPF